MKHERSWEINGNQMPVCTRDVGMFFGIAVGVELRSIPALKGYVGSSVHDARLAYPSRTSIFQRESSENPSLLVYVHIIYGHFICYL